MPASLNEIKTKISSTKKTSQITGAMQMVSAAKLQKSEKHAQEYQLYASKVRELTLDLVSRDNEPSKNPMMLKRPIKRTAYLVISSDRGLVGGYNANILKAVVAELHKKEDESKFSIFALGGMGADFFKSRGFKLAYELRDISDQPSFDEVREIVAEGLKLYQEGEFDELIVCYNHHINSLTSQVRMERMLPLSFDEVEQKEDSVRSSFELEPDRETILDQILPQYAHSMIYGSIVDAKTAEHAAGMSAMRTATDNARSVINDLTIQYNRARQAAITQEITEIVAGASAL